MELPERIRRWRTSRDGMTQTALAKKVGVASEAVCQWESGAATPTTRHVAAVAEAIGVSLAVFYGEPPAEPKRRKRGAA